uniref:Uncharacterized protein n=1 Tax=Cacopsylla melanoneura TaxID=428564 RepID=A0A8D8XIM7_9HEMI
MQTSSGSNPFHWLIFIELCWVGGKSLSQESHTGKILLYHAFFAETYRIQIDCEVETLMKEAIIEYEVQTQLLVINSQFMFYCRLLENHPCSVCLHHVLCLSLIFHGA